MVGMWQSYSDIYLYISGIAMLACFGLPLLMAPLEWARLFRWQVPQEHALVLFLGRSMGVFVCLMAIFAVEATRVPAAKPFFFDLMLCTFAAMLALHIYGAILKMQPFTETAEISLWIALFFLTLCFYPA